MRRAFRIARAVVTVPAVAVAVVPIAVQVGAFVWVLAVGFAASEAVDAWRDR